MKHNLAIFISGSGTTMEAMLQEIAKGELPITASCIIASNEHATGIAKAKKYLPNEKIHIINPTTFQTEKKTVNREAFGRAILAVLHSHQVSVITQNGWLPKTPNNVVEAFNNRIYNQHPGPLPETAGQYGRMPLATMLYLRQKQQKDWWSEVVAHRVVAEFDKGSLVKKQQVAITSKDTVDTLQEKTLPAEHQVQIALLRDIANETVTEITEVSEVIRPNEEQLLKDARRHARELYPKG